ncbi:MAG: T9SS type A sorting domain-containing protein [Crocinitomix sp.]|nr:T9SS type A sorting domain-containing protein [Crocinitomix sp.]
MKNIYQLFVTFFLVLLFSPQLFAQDEVPIGCGLHKVLPAIYEAYPGLEQDQKELLERSKNYTKTRGGDRAESYIIPVVFHVIHENGSENISDAQILDQMAILNRDFSKLNADTTEIMEEFKDLAADTGIEFRLANIDPYGNCTNGIEHIYSHETNIGDDFSKLNQWPRTRYLNVWIVKSMRAGVAGYAYYPSSVSGSLFFADGIIILNNYIGSTGTGSAYSSRALTHEIGHWLSLPHVWGSNNSPGVACGDDSIEDTPVTAGHTTCALVETDDCNTDIAENVQNYMEYSYCSRMFTYGQTDVMTLTLETPISGRNNLHTDANLTSTGTIDGPVLCTPLPDFYLTSDIVCPGVGIQYFPAVTRAVTDEYSWAFPGGTPAYSNEVSPIITYATPGIYDAQLTVTNAAGSETTTKTRFTHVLGDYWKYEGPHAEDFENENFETDGWHVFNPENNEVEWSLVDYAGRSGTQCIGLEYFRADPDPILYPNYYQRIGRTKDILISPSFNLSNTSDAVLSFNYIFATTNGGVFDPQDMELRVSYWKDCEAEWTLLDNINANDLICVGHHEGNFTPTAADNWQNVAINLPSGTETSNVRFKIEFTAADFLNNFFIDDFNVSGLLSTQDNDLILQDVSIFPNPSSIDQNITLAYYSTTSNPMQIDIYDMLGNQIYSTVYNSTLGMNKQSLTLGNAGLSKGIYNVVLSTEGAVLTKRLILK